MSNDLDQIYARALEDVQGAADEQSIHDLSVKYLGRKGVITLFLRNISQLPAQERPAAGQKANALKKKLESRFEDALKRLRDAHQGPGDQIDVSLPGRRVSTGGLHPITQINQQICEIFERMGFNIAEGPEIEEDYYNFTALNFPKNHPARDMQDTFFVSDDIVLRTHTSPLQVRVMEKQAAARQGYRPGQSISLRFRCNPHAHVSPGGGAFGR